MPIPIKRQQEKAALALSFAGLEADEAKAIAFSDEVFAEAARNQKTIDEFIQDEIKAGSFQKNELCDDGEALSEDYLDDMAAPVADGVQPPGGDSADDDKDEIKYRSLGYSGDTYYYFSYAKKQIVALTPGQHNLQNLLQLADLKHWRDVHGAKGQAADSKIALSAADSLMKFTIKKGIFDPKKLVRGCGAWMDDGRVVLHCGDCLYVDGKKVDIIKFKSKYLYVAAAKLLTPAIEPLSNAEAHKLRVLCEMPTWENKLSGSLLAGWLVIAPICAALEWRPHIWLEGQPESGKSTIMDKIIKPVLGDIAICFDAGTTEAAIRNISQYDARPIVYDEAEKNRHIMEGVLSLCRLASSGGSVQKFGQSPFTARFSACFSAIRPPIGEFADESRISRFLLRQNRSVSRQKDYADLLHAIQDTITPDFSSKLLSRIVTYLPTLLKNIATFKKAANTVLRGARASDQIAPMLAGLFFLHGTGEVSQETAEKFISAQDWGLHTNINADHDSVRCIQHLCSHLIRYAPQNGTTTDVSFGDIIESAMGHNLDIKREWAEKTLRNYGILIKDDGVLIANKTQNLEKIFKDTPWSVGWKGDLEAIEGATKERKVYFTAGMNTSATKVPLTMFGKSEVITDNKNIEEIPLE